ncbi:fatty-acid--CoA ligase [Mycobacterium sp. ACS1612]|uniref:fatty-acid--CoA ligase n=1 Tax=Mycobacterium sp. ACS1612 TaxID=1834117 RepID=UPI0007FD265C|nr:fatty-acid--CoA ligase [Mycobacterium sp. ACS1612]OBF26897.1 fatty-acid--CoA ligase [Mycobacterium sp. ACS1612]
MNHEPAHSLVLTTDYRVPDPTRVWPLLQRRRDGLRALGAHHVFVYTSTTDPERVLVTIALETREPVVELLRSRAFFEWFDAVGVEDLPAVFAGELIERFDFVGDSAAAPGIVVVGIMVVDDPASFRVHVRETRDLFLKAGIRRVRIFEAFDDPDEVMFLHELTDAESVKHWLQRPDIASEWFSDAGVGAYPPLFVGRLAHAMRIEP